MGQMVRFKVEVIISNLLHQYGVPFFYERLLLADDGTMRLPDFTVQCRGETYFWEHLGLLDQTIHTNEWAIKRAWYEKGLRFLQQKGRARWSINLVASLTCPAAEPSKYV